MSLLKTVVIVGILTCATSALAATQSQIESARAKGFAWLMANQNGDGSWQTASGLGVQSTATAIEAMLNAGISKGRVFGAAVAWLKNADAPSIDSLSRKIIALSRAGANATSDLDHLVASGNSVTNATWGAYDKYDTSFPDTTLALGAIRLSNYSYPSNYTSQYLAKIGSVYCDIIPAQQSGGGWSYLKPLPSSPISQMGGAIVPTAYNIIELQAIMAATGWDVRACGSSYSLNTSITNGTAWLWTARGTLLSKLSFSEPRVTLMNLTYLTTSPSSP
jgi:hypothetical protein